MRPPQAPENAAVAASTPMGWALVMMGITGGWIALWWLSQFMEYAPHASLWYPPAALSYAVFRRFGYQGIPAIVLASLTATILAGETYQIQLSLRMMLLSGLLYAGSHGVPYYLAARLMANYAPTGSSRAAPRTAIAFLIVSTLASLLAATLGAASLTLTGMIGEAEALALILPWWIGDFAGLLALGPAAIALLNRATQWLKFQPADLVPPDRFLSAGDRSRQLFVIRLAVCIGMIMVSASLASLFPDHEPVAFLVFFVIIPQMWIVHSEGAMRSVASVAINSSAMAIAIPVFGLGDQALIYQFAMIIIAASAYFGMAVPMLFADNAELRHLVITDSLTGAATRHHFRSETRNELDRAKRYGESVSLIVFDIDQFKSINDSGGHALGDRVLANMARACRAALRGTDLLGRLGGDEFIVLLPMTPLAEAVDAAERLRQAITESSVISDAGAVRISASLGVVEIDVEHESWQLAFERADRALYQAKRAGRDRVEVA